MLFAMMIDVLYFISVKVCKIADINTNKIAIAKIMFERGNGLKNIPTICPSNIDAKTNVKYFETSFFQLNFFFARMWIVLNIIPRTAPTGMKYGEIGMRKIELNASEKNVKLLRRFSNHFTLSSPSFAIATVSLTKQKANASKTNIAVGVKEAVKLQTASASITIDKIARVLTASKDTGFSWLFLKTENPQTTTAKPKNKENVIILITILYTKFEYFQTIFYDFIFFPSKTAIYFLFERVHCQSPFYQILFYCGFLHNFFPANIRSKP